jgi:adenylate cyclase
LAKSVSTLSKENIILQRRLTAILAADVVDYTRLMGEDEARTLAALNTLREDLFQPKIRDANGKVIKRMGDGWIVEFANVSEAVACAVEIQQRLADHDFIRLRVGVHIGDVTFQDEDIYGDGINVAARLEELAEPGQVLISDTAHHSLDNKALEEFGGGETIRLKNVARPVAVWHWPAGSRAGVLSSGTGNGEGLPLPDKPSIAVLPFDNLSGDPEQEYFSDGMSEEVITALSRLRWLFVIARNSSFTYKGQAVDVKRVGREMGVRYVLEGSVRKSGQRVRVTAQLIEAESGNHIWAERYDRALTDIFDLQDDLTEAISAEVDAELASSERAIAHNKPITDLDAWELYQRGMWHHYKYSEDGVIEEQRLFQRASERAPEFAKAYAGLAHGACNAVTFGFEKDRAATLAQGLRDAEKAVALDDRDGYCHFALGNVCMFLGDRDRSIPAFEKAIDLSPSFAASYLGLGRAFYWFGRAAEAIPLFDRAIRLSPHDPMFWAFLHLRGASYLLLDEVELAIIDTKAAIQAKTDDFWSHLTLAGAYASLGSAEAAGAALDRACELNPKLSIAYFRHMLAGKHPPSLDKEVAALRKAGLRED